MENSFLGFGHLETAQVFLKLMKRLSFEQFFVQGGDWGSIIASDMATMYPEQWVHLVLNESSLMVILH